jgi:hypothetical protein
MNKQQLLGLIGVMLTAVSVIYPDSAALADSRIAACYSKSRGLVNIIKDGLDSTDTLTTPFLLTKCKNLKGTLVIWNKEGAVGLPGLPGPQGPQGPSGPAGGVAVVGSDTLTLTRNLPLVNVDDAAGGWQHEGGTVNKGGTVVGFYALHRRVTLDSRNNALGGTGALNTAMVTMTLFLNTAQVPNSAPRNITIEGAWDFTSGSFLGSVAAASSEYNWVQGADVRGESGGIGITNLFINWNSLQLNQPQNLTLP